MEEQISIEEALNLPVTKEFIELSRDYCEYIENGKESDIDFLRIIQPKLLRLYSTGLNLPQIDFKHHENLGSKLSKDEYNKAIDFDNKLNRRDIEKLANSIDTRIGDKRFYLVVLDPLNYKSVETGTGDLLDDIQDIYRDLKESLALYDFETMISRESALWDMKFLYQKHWGEHAIDALNIIHHILDWNESL